jgi:hypothetical protein
MCMPWLGHVHALAGASGPSLRWSERFGRTDYPMRKPRPFAIAYCPIICTQCVDCSLDTFAADEWFMLRNEVWEQVWEGRRAPWHRKVPGAEIRQPGAPVGSGDSLH